MIMVLIFHSNLSPRFFSRHLRLHPFPSSLLCSWRLPFPSSSFALLCSDLLIDLALVFFFSGRFSDSPWDLNKHTFQWANSRAVRITPQDQQQGGGEDAPLIDLFDQTSPNLVITPGILEVCMF